MFYTLRESSATENMSVQSALFDSVNNLNVDTLQQAAEKAANSVRLWSSIGLVMGMYMIVSFFALILVQWVDIYLFQYGLLHFNLIPAIYVIGLTFVMVILVTFNRSSVFLRILLIFIAFFGGLALISHIIYIVKGFFTYGTCGQITSGAIVITNMTVVNSSLGTGPHLAMCMDGTITRFIITNIIIYVWVIVEFVSIILAIYMAFVVESSLAATIMRQARNYVEKRRKDGTIMNSQSKHEIGEILEHMFIEHQVSPHLAGMSNEQIKEKFGLIGDKSQ